MPLQIFQVSPFLKSDYDQERGTEPHENAENEPGDLELAYLVHDRFTFPSEHVQSIAEDHTITVRCDVWPPVGKHTANARKNNRGEQKHQCSHKHGDAEDRG